MRHFIVLRDHSLMRRVHGWMPPRWVRVWMLVASRAGDGWLWYALGVAILMFGGDDRFRAAGAGTLAGVMSLALFYWLKRITGRRRPCELEPHCWATLLPPDQFSFPSGHTMPAWAISIAVGLFYPSLLPALLFVAVSIAASRIVLGMHFLSDVLAAIAVGFALGYGSWALFA